uniref:FYVE and coiled-coil domain autophagy adaptor 1 n=1 Tax=Scleropages formosus TaxID=113540 RepID=A0A8C9TPT5_SCLFO
FASTTSKAVAELSREYKDIGDPITDDSPSLHKFSYKLEYLLQFDQKEKKTLLGTRKDYWDYFCDCLAKIKGANDGIRYVKSIPVLKTSLGKGRAFIRYSLVHQRLADTLQQCLMNERVTSEWYYARSPFLKSHLNVDIISHLYELNEVQFDVASMGYDLDSAWPTFARRSLGSPAHLWKPPSRYSSVSSLVSSYSQQAPDFLCSPDQGPSLLSNIGETASCWVVDDLRMELDQSELKRQELLEQVRQLQEESAGLRALVRDLEGQLQGHLKQSLCRSHQETLENQRALELTNQETAERLLTTARELEALRAEATAGRELEAKLSSAECRNMELLAQLDGALGEKGRQAASHFDSAQKIHTLLDKLNEAEKEKLEALREADGRKREAERLAEELRMKESSMFTREENSAMLKQVKDLQSTIKKLQGALTVKEKESSNLQMQLQDLQNSQEVRERQVEELKRRIQAEKEDLQQRHSSLKEQMEGQIHNMTEQLKAKEDGLSTSVKKIQGLEKQVEKLVSEKEGLWNNLVELEGNVKDQARRIEEYKMQLRGQGGDAVFAVDEGERQLREENILLDESLQRAMLLKEVSKGAVRRLEQENCELRVEEGMEKGALSLMQEELCSVSAQIAELEKNLATSKSNEETLQEKLQENSLLQLNMRLGEDLCVQVDELEGRWVKNSQEGSSRLALAEGQLDLSVKEVSRLRDEVVDLRCKLQDLTEEKLKVQAQLEVTEASRQELKALVKQFKGQVEELNRRHVQELLQHKQKEVALERETEAQALESTSSKEELASLKRSHELLALESAETKDCLQRVNMEMAELSIHICSLNSEKDDTQRRLGSASTRLREMEEEVACGVEQLLVLQRENANLREELCKLESLQGKLEQAETQSRSLQESAEEEINAIRFQMSCETLNHQSQLKVLLKVTPLHNMSNKAIENKWQGLNKKKKHTEVMKFYKNQLNRAVAERKSCDMKTSAEIDDLYRTKKNLEERLIELIRDKDTLWQKWDALEFQQKQRCEEVTEKDASHCLACQGQFSWWQRRHPCRLCGRTFCYYCSNCSSKVTPGGKRERCCRNCSASPDHQIETELGSPPSTPNSHSASYGHRPHVSGEGRPARAVIFFDMKDFVDNYSDSFNFRSTRTGDTTTEDADDLSLVVQDAEIYLLKSGEITLTVPFSLDEVSLFGEAPRELFIKSSCYSIIPITVPEAGHTISWLFSSEPKSISFGVVHREANNGPLEQSKVLIPLTRCNSHKETIQGQLKVRNPGTYTLIFDNSFSRFISKKVQYHLTVKKPIICDRSESS